jgi:hypothetical protein
MALAPCALSLSLCSACASQTGPAGFLSNPNGVADGGGGSLTDSASGSVEDAGAGLSDVSLLLGGDVSAKGPCSGLGTGTCKEGTYTGTFSCFYDADGGTMAPDGGLSITGTLTLTLTRSSSGEFVDTASGNFTANTVGINATANIGGTLDCNTGWFTGMLTNGTFMGWLIINGTFNGPLGACYNGATSSFVNGTWVMYIVDQAGKPIGTCPGTWSAR